MRKVVCLVFLIVVLLYLVGCEKDHSKQIADCNKDEPLTNLNSTVPEWEIRPNNFFKYRRTIKWFQNILYPRQQL